MVAIVIILLSIILGWFGVEWLTESMGLINIIPDIELQEWYSIYRMLVFVPNLIITGIFLLLVMFIDMKSSRFWKYYRILSLVYFILIFAFNISGITYSKYVISGSFYVALLNIIVSILIYWAGSVLIAHRSMENLNIPLYEILRMPFNK